MTNIKQTIGELLGQLGLTTTVHFDKNLNAVGQLKPGESVYIVPGDYLVNKGLKEIVISHTVITDEPIDFFVYRHLNGERTEIFSTTIPADRLEQRTFNNGTSLPEVIVPQPNEVWELQVPVDSAVAFNSSMMLSLVPGRW